MVKMLRRLRSPRRRTPSILRSPQEKYQAKRKR
jgi:hypothetical protein